MRRRHVRSDEQSLGIIGDGAVEIALGLFDKSAEAKGIGVFGIESQILVEIGQCPIPVFPALPDHSASVIRRLVVRIQRQGLRVIVHGLVQVARVLPSQASIREVVRSLRVAGQDFVVGLILRAIARHGAGRSSRIRRFGLPKTGPLDRENNEKYRAGSGDGSGDDIGLKAIQGRITGKTDLFHRP